MPLPDLLHTLHGRDLGFLRMVAGLWGIELEAANVRAALPQLTQAMLNPELANEIVATLPAAVQDAVATLAEAGGLIPWSQFIRTYGEVRTMGAAKRDRERPDLNPRTPGEMAWYYGLIGQAFWICRPSRSNLPISRPIYFRCWKFHGILRPSLLAARPLPERLHASLPPVTGCWITPAPCWLPCAWVCRRIKSPNRAGTSR